MRRQTRVTVAALVTATLVASGAMSWPYVEPYAEEATGTVLSYVSVLEESARASFADSEPRTRPVDAPPAIEQPDSRLLDELRGPLRSPSAPPDLSGETGAQAWEAQAALASITTRLGSAKVDLDGLWQPSAEARALTDTLTRGTATSDVTDRAVNQEVVRIASAIDHASAVLGPGVVASLVTEFRARELGAPSANSILTRQVDGYFESLWLLLGTEPTLDAILNVNSDTFGAFGVDESGRLRPAVDLTYRNNGTFRVSVDAGGVEATVWHELGHAVLALAQRLNGLDRANPHWTADEASVERHLKSVLGATAWSDRAYGLSGYAAESTNELVAEAFAEYLGTDNPRPTARAVVAEVLGAIRNAPPDAVALWMGG